MINLLAVHFRNDLNFDCTEKLDWNNLEETCQQFLIHLKDHYTQTFDGYLDIKQLLDDTVLISDPANQNEFNIHVDESIPDKIIIRSG